MSYLYECPQLSEVPQEVFEIMDSFGFSGRFKGYKYLAYAIYINIRDNLSKNQIARVFSETANSFNTTPNKVLLCIKYSTEKMMKSCNMELIEAYFKGSVNTKKNRISPQILLHVLSKIVLDEYENSK